MLAARAADASGGGAGQRAYGRWLDVCCLLTFYSVGRVSLLLVGEVRDYSMRNDRDAIVLQAIDRLQKGTVLLTGLLETQQASEPRTFAELARRARAELERRAG